MNRSYVLCVLCAAAFSIITVPTQAALVSVLGGAVVYDTDRDISWISNANLALTNQFGLTLSTSVLDATPNTVGSAGKMTWDNAVAWIAGMNSANYLGFNNWHLPDTPQPDASCGFQSDPGGGSPQQGYGFSCTGSEMGHLYNDEGVTAASQGLFSNVQPGPTDWYWSSTEYAPDTSGAWIFKFDNGYQYFGPKSDNYYAWAVHSGNVSAVPIPAAVWLFGSGLLGLIGIARSKQAR